MTTSALARPLPRSPRGLRSVAAGLLVLQIACVSAVLGYQLAYTGRIYPGVTALGADLGGQSPSEAEATLQARFRRLAESTVTLRHGGQAWPVSRADLGLSLDAPRVAGDGYLVGRERSIGARLVSQVDALRLGRSLDAGLSFDGERAAAALARIAPEVARAPADAVLVITPGGDVQVVPSQAGVALDGPRAVAAIRAALLATSSDELELPTTTVPPAVDEGRLAAVRERVQEIIGRPLTLVAGGRSWTLSRPDLVALVSVAPTGDGVDGAQVDEARLTAYLEEVARQVDRAPAGPRLERSGARVTVAPGDDGEELDVAASRDAVVAQLGEAGPSALVTRRVPGLSPEALASLQTQLDGLLASPPTFEYGDRAWAVPAGELAEMLTLEGGAEGESPTIGLDEARLTAFVAGVAGQVAQDARDAVVRVRDGRYVVVADSQDALEVDVAASVAAARAALAGRGGAIPLVVKAMSPALSSARASIAAPGPDLIIQSTTTYQGLGGATAQNIELAARRLNGLGIGPGEVFSFNQAVGPATVASGYALGFGITLNGRGEVRTVPSEAGGICRVATALFQAVFWAGYPIVERGEHLYWIASYGQPPLGLKGLDAAVDEPSNLDLKFRNSTSSWVVIEASASGGRLRVALKGEKPSWTVTVGQPRYSGVVPANRATVREEDPTMPFGSSSTIEVAEDGFSAAIERTVTEGDRTIDRWTAQARYLPSRNVVRVGTAGAPAPTPAPRPASPARP